MRRSLFALAFIAAALTVTPSVHAQKLSTQPLSVYSARRHALADSLKGGWALVFAATEPVLDFDPYRQNPDFYYLTGWNEPGAALVVAPGYALCALHEVYGGRWYGTAMRALGILAIHVATLGAFASIALCR